MMKTKVLHHAGVAAKTSQQACEEADEEDDPEVQGPLQEDAEPKLLLVVGVLQLYEDVDSVWFLQHRIFPTGTCGSLQNLS